MLYCNISIIILYNTLLCSLSVTADLWTLLFLYHMHADNQDLAGLQSKMYEYFSSKQSIAELYGVSNLFNFHT